MKRTCHMELPGFVYRKMRERFGPLQPAFESFLHSHIDPSEVEEVLEATEEKFRTGQIQPDPIPTVPKG